MRLAISLPTRGRADQLIDTVERSVANWVLPTTKMWIMADRDDPETVSRFWEAQKKWNTDGPRVYMSIEPREDTIAAKWNRVLGLDPDADVYLTDADDAPQITPGYDRKILDAASLFPDGLGFVYGHMANASFTCSESLTRKVVQKLGYIFPPYFPYWFVDHWIDDVARITGRISVADIRTDQSSVGKTQEMREPGWWATWFDAAYMIRRNQAFEIIDDLEEPEWRKKMLRAQAPLIEYRSRWINDSVRANERQLMQVLGRNDTDERYKRLRAKAVAMLPDMLMKLPSEQAVVYSNYLMPSTTLRAIG